MNSQGYMYMLIEQINRHLYKIAHCKNTASNLLDYIEKKALRCDKKERFLHQRLWSRARQRERLTDQISFERLKNYFERLAVNGLKQNKNFERLTVNGYGKISNGVSFLTESELNQKGALYVNNQP